MDQFLSYSARLMIALFATAIAAAQPVPTGIAIPAMAAYDNLAVNLMRDYHIPGGAIAVVRDGKLVFARGYGHANTDTGELVRPDSYFRIASLSKPITAAAILLLVERGKLSLDQRVFDILTTPPLPGMTANPDLATITVRELLQHSGGWNRDATIDPMFMPVAIAKASGTAPPANTATIIRYMRGKRLQFQPGTGFNYSNFGYALLGRVIEAVSGQSYETFVREQVLESSGAKCMNIGRSLSTQPLPREVKYYDYPDAPQITAMDGKKCVPRPDGSFFLEAMDSHGGWVGSTIDYLRFVLSVDGQDYPTDILSASSITEMASRPNTGAWTNRAPWYAMGWWVRPQGTNANWWHFGVLPGTATLVVRNFNGVSWAAFFNSMPQEDAFLDDLDRGLREVFDSITNWPTVDQFPSYQCTNAQRRRAVRH